MKELYTEKQIMTALELRMTHDLLSREAYKLINQKNAKIQELEEKTVEKAGGK